MNNKQYVVYVCISHVYTVYISYNCYTSFCNITYDFEFITNIYLINMMRIFVCIQAIIKHVALIVVMYIIVA